MLSKPIAKLFIIILGFLMVLTTAKVAMAMYPSVPSIRVDAEVVAGNTINAFVTGSTDPDGDPVTYYCSFYNPVTKVMLLDQSTSCSYQTVLADLNQTLIITARAFDGEEYGPSMTKDVRVVSSKTTSGPTAEAQSDITCDDGMVVAETATGLRYCDFESAGAKVETDYMDKALQLGWIIWPTSPKGGLVVIILLTIVVTVIFFDSREKMKMNARMQAMQRRRGDDDEW